MGWETLLGIPALVYRGGGRRGGKEAVIRFRSNGAKNAGHSASRRYQMSHGNGGIVRFCALTTALAVVVLGGSFSQAANTWDGGGGDNNWGTANNWDNDQVPTFPAPLTFAGNTRLQPNNNLTNPAPSVDGVTLDTSAGAFTIGGQP